MNDISDLRKDIQYMFTQQKSMKCIHGVNIFNKYTVKAFIGNGNTRVYLAQDQVGGRVAIKEVTNYQVQNSDIQNMMKEVKLLESLNHPNIVQYLDSCVLFHSNNQYHQEKFGYICMELALFDLETFKKQGNTIGEELIDQTLSAFAYLQRNHIAHCDIKPANILIMQQDPILYKICDVGASKHQGSLLSHTIGTYKYMSPEMLRGEATNFYLSDVFSLGILFLGVFKNYSMAFAERKEISDEQFVQMMHSQLNDDIISKLLFKMIQVDPMDRTEFIELELFWNNLKYQREREEQNKSLFRQTRVQSNFQSIQEDSPIKLSYYTTGRWSKKQKLLPQFYSVSPSKQNLSIETKVVTTKNKRVRQQSIFPIQEPLYIKTSPLKSPDKSKVQSPIKLNQPSKFQLPQLKDDRIRPFKVRPIQL